MALLDSVAVLVSRMNVGPLTVYRPGQPTQDDFGDFVEAAPLAVTINPVHVHTLAGRELEQLPEGDRYSEMIQLYTTERLYVADGGEVADRVVYRGRTWRVTKADDYELQGGVWMALAALEDERGVT